MFWTTGLILVALTLGRVPGGLAKPGVIEDAMAEASTSSERIVSGWEAYPGQFPYVAALRGVTAAGGVIVCVGSVVHTNWVLTSAWCTDPRRSIVVRAGITDLTTTPEYISETTEWRSHPAFSINGTNNISIIKLLQAIIYSVLVQSVRIQPRADAFADYENEVVIASGWGRLSNGGSTPNVLNWVYLRAMSNQECTGRQTPLDDNHICTRGYNVTSQATCAQDCGGPLAHVGRDGVPVLVGITTILAGYNCGLSGNPAAFTRPGPFHSWLTEVTGGIDFDEAPESITTVANEPPTTEATEPSTTKVTEPSTINVTEPPTTEATEPPTTESTEPPTTESTEPPTTEATEPPTTKAPEPDNEDNEGNSNDSDDSESKEESEFGNKQVKVKVKVINNVKIG